MLTCHVNGVLHQIVRSYVHPITGGVEHLLRLLEDRDGTEEDRCVQDELIDPEE
jgi:hypothetical protein